MAKGRHRRGASSPEELWRHGQSVWIDFISRPMIESGQLAGLVASDGVRGVTSNPAIFEKAIAEGQSYEAEIRALALAGREAAAIVRALTVEDIRRTADVLRRVYDLTNGMDGYVSLEVSPRLAHDTRGTVAEAQQLWATVGRPNVMIKVPATREGLPAIRELTAQGVNVNVTLLFGLPRYREVVAAHLAGLEQRVERGDSLGRINSVASFFLSRIDTLLDPSLARTPGVTDLVGEVAIASAKVAYQMWKELVTSDRFARVAARGARAQRLLWASTSTKNPAYPDTKYIEPLIGPNTVTTMPLETLEAYRDHGRPAVRLEAGVDAARGVFDRLARAGIDIDRATQQLEDEGIEKFAQPWARLLAKIELRRRAAVAAELGRDQAP